MNDQLELKTLLKHLFASGKTPGLQYVVRRNNETIFQENLGMAEFESNKFISTSSFFNACSVTKTFTSLAIMQLAEAGKLKLSDPCCTLPGQYSLSRRNNDIATIVPYFRTAKSNTPALGTSCRRKKLLLIMMISSLPY